MSIVHYIFLTAICLFTTAFAKCGCTRNENNKAQPYIVELSRNGLACPSPPNSSESQCYQIDCAMCDQILECYVKTGNPDIDEKVCEVVMNDDMFCLDSGTSGGGSIGSSNDNGEKRMTLCGQQCSLQQGRTCYKGENWGQCPAVVGDTREISGPSKTSEPCDTSVSTCKEGAGKGGPAALSNFALYEIYIGGDESNCEASESCSTGENGEVIYKCTVSAECTTKDTVSCLSEKCDSDTSETNECPCARDLAA